MSVIQIFFESLRSLLINKLRSTLTTLGIVIGVAAVIAMISLGRGVQEAVSGQFAGLGTSTLTVYWSPEDDRALYRPLTLADAEALANPLNVPGIEQVAASLYNSGTAAFGSHSAKVTIYGVTANYGSVMNLKLQEGSFFDEGDILGQTSTLIIGSRAAQKLFQRERGLVGEIVRVENQPYRIIGVLQEQGASAVSMGPDDLSVLAPITTAQSRLTARYVRNQVDFLTVQVQSLADSQTVSNRLKEFLRIRHNLPVGSDDFYVFAPQQFLDALQNILRVLTIFLGGIAAISLVVGGIGIMNIMLVSVTERTREIGLRKAIGASKQDILIQFLIEAALLSLSGGLIGILLGWLIGVVISVLAASSGTPITPRVGLDAILLATLFSSAIGIFFGFYPANRAANLTPVEALRAE